jgi:UDP-N-acetylglucosamine 2-epimerase (non-hydrolysing)
MPEPDLWLAKGVNGESLQRGSDVAKWLRSIEKNVRQNRRQLEDILWADDRPPLVLVHGDTMTTVVGALLGRLLGATVGHVEAGMRSNNLLNPFPEELDRRVAGHLSHIHFTPGLDKVPNLRRSRGIKVDTVVNTVFDSLRMVPASSTPAIPNLPDGYGLVLLHRFEFLRNRQLLIKTFELLAEKAKSGTPMVVVADAQASTSIEDAGLERLFDDTFFIRAEKQAYFDFVPLVRSARFVITDSGGLQEECFYLNKPCLVHRTTTEQSGGLGENVVLSNHDLGVVEKFLTEPEKYRSPRVDQFPSPTEIICDYLRRAGHIPDPDGPERKRRDLSVIIPVRGGGEFIRSMLLTVMSELDRTTYDYEIVVVSDGSRDSTVSEAKTIESDRILVLHYAENAGHGFAVRYGFAHSTGDLVAVIAPDLAFLPDSLPPLVARMEETDADIVNGSKLHESSDVPMHPLRRWQTTAFSMLVASLFGVTVADPQNGMKLFRRSALEDLLPHVQSNGFAFDVELLASATLAGMKIEEGPVHALSHFVPTRSPLDLVRILAGVARLAAVRARMSPARRAS